MIREKVPFPGTLGRVCIHPCEQACRRGQLNSPISIKELKRVAADLGDASWKINSASHEPTGRRVAIVGAGPAGLTAAYYLAKKGHGVTVFDALPEPGGMMRVGIPEYRLPRGILAGEIDIIRQAGVDIVLNTKIESIQSLKERGYNAVLLSIGAHRGLKLGVAGEDLDGVMDAASFLREVNLGKNVSIGNKVAIIGGGNSAIDSARVALRLGARDITLIYRRTRTEMPASPEEVEDALHEGISIMFLATPSKITRNDGMLSLECVRMRLGEPDASGRRRPEPIPGSEFTMAFDSVIVALGQAPELPSQFELKVGRGNVLQVDNETLQTSQEGVFAAGDAVTGPASVIEAIAAGRKVASSIDRYLGGTGIIDEILVASEESSGWLGRAEGFADAPREEPSSIPVESRCGGFTEVKYALGHGSAHKEAERCLRCDLRLRITPVPLPPLNDKAGSVSKSLYVSSQQK